MCSREGPGAVEDWGGGGQRYTLVLARSALVFAFSAESLVPPYCTPQLRFPLRAKRRRTAFGAARHCANFAVLHSHGEPTGHRYRLSRRG